MGEVGSVEIIELKRIEPKKYRDVFDSSLFYHIDDNKILYSNIRNEFHWYPLGLVVEIKNFDYSGKKIKIVKIQGHPQLHFVRIWDNPVKT